MSPFAAAPLKASFASCARFLPAMLTLGLVAAVGRAVQEGAAGEITRGTHLALEIVVESARVVFVLYVLGAGSVSDGWAMLRGFFRKGGGRWGRLRGLLVGRRRELALSLGGFVLVAGLANIAIFAMAHRWGALAMLQHCGWIAEQAGPWVTVLFLKNLSVIPWTLAFVVALGRWLTSEKSAA